MQYSWCLWIWTEQTSRETRITYLNSCLSLRILPFHLRFPLFKVIRLPHHQRQGQHHTPNVHIRTMNNVPLYFCISLKDSVCHSLLWCVVIFTLELRIYLNYMISLEWITQVVTRIKAVSARMLRFEQIFFLNRST